MHIHLIQTPEVDIDKYNNVLEILQKIPGPLKFFKDKNSLATDEENSKTENTKTPSKNHSINFFDNKIEDQEEHPKPEAKRQRWKDLFEICNFYRQTHLIAEDEWVILLTDDTNEYNWFAGADPKTKNNFFIHADQWERYVPCDARFPIAYQIMAIILQRYMFTDMIDLQKKLHKKPIGCINDFCKNKEDIIFKLRTADICVSCQKEIIDLDIDGAVINQIIRTTEDIRHQMLFRERFKTTKVESRISIRGPKKRIFFTDMGDAELKLNPLEKCIYLLFLKIEEGIYIHSLSEHQEWLEHEYSFLGNGTLAEMQNRIGQLVNPLENSAHEKISKIKRKIEQLLGNDLSKNYTIEGPRGDKNKILLNRTLVTYDENWRENA